VFHFLGTNWEIRDFVSKGQSSCHFQKEGFSVLLYALASTSVEISCSHSYEQQEIPVGKFIDTGIPFHLVAPECIEIRCAGGMLSHLHSLMMSDDVTYVVIVFMHSCSVKTDGCLIHVGQCPWSGKHYPNYISNTAKAFR